MTRFVLLLLAAAPVDPLQTSSVLQVTGWSADETKFSVRAFDLDDSEEQQACPGYVDHEGKPFIGKLVLAAYDRGALVQSFVVQDYPKCTPPAKAKEVLEAAKKKFAELGIDLSAKGTQLDCSKSCDLGHGATLELEGVKVRRDEEAMQGTIKGTMRIWLTTAKERTKLFEKVVKEEFPLMMGGRGSAGLRPVELSPQRGALIIRASIDTYSGRGGASWKMFSLGYFAFEGDLLVRGGVPTPYIPTASPK